MGSASRKKPERLAEKLLQIRLGLKLSQNEMLNRLKLEDVLTRIDISKYEQGVREPSLITLLEYARTVNVSTDILIIDDKASLP